MNELIMAGPDPEVEQMDNNLITVTLQMPRDEAIKARVIASQQNKSRSQLMRDALKEYLQKQESEVGENGAR